MTSKTVHPRTSPIPTSNLAALVAAENSARMATDHADPSPNGAVSIGAWLFAFFLVPETKGKTLEQIEAHWQSGKPARAL